MTVLLISVLEKFFHLDVYLTSLTTEHSLLIYILLFLVIFCETGLVVTPFLPGDSLLFATGTLAALGSLSVLVLWAILLLAAFLGDTVNYWIGRKFGTKIFEREYIRFLNKEHLTRTQRFFERYGGKTIILARFIPIIRTFAPFVAGIGSMEYKKFIGFNFAGGLLWVSLFLFAGYFFGNVPIIKQNFSLAIIAVILISLLPVPIEYLRNRFKKPVIHT